MLFLYKLLSKKFIMLNYSDILLKQNLSFNLLPTSIRISVFIIQTSLDLREFGLALLENY